MVTSHFKTCGVNESNVFVLKQAVFQFLSFAIVFGQLNEVECSIEIEHVEVINGNTTETVHPARIQVNALAIPMNRTVVLLLLTVTSGKAVNQNVRGGKLAQTLPIVIKCSVYLTLFGALNSFLLPEIRAIHVSDVAENFHWFPFQHWHR